MPADAGAATPDAEAAWPRSDGAGMAPSWGVSSAVGNYFLERLRRGVIALVAHSGSLPWRPLGERLALTALSASQHTGASESIIAP